MTSLLDSIKKLSHEYADEVVSYRRHLHAHPELSYQEHNTARFVAEILKRVGLEPQEGVAGTGVIAHISGNKPSKKLIALRADLDALPIQEANAVPYRSQNPGVMHACGHDVHTSSLLGTARILHTLRNEFEGSIKL